MIGQWGNWGSFGASTTPTMHAACVDAWTDVLIRSAQGGPVSPVWAQEEAEKRCRGVGAPPSFTSRNDCVVWTQRKYSKPPWSFPGTVVTDMQRTCSRYVELKAPPATRPAPTKAPPAFERGGGHYFRPPIDDQTVQVDTAPGYVIDAEAGPAPIDDPGGFDIESDSAADLAYTYGPWVGGAVAILLLAGGAYFLGSRR